MEQFGFVFDYGLRGDRLKAQHAAEQQRLQELKDSRNPYKIYTHKQRYEYYWNNYAWEHPYDVVAKFGVYTKHHGFILPSFYRGIYERQVRAVARKEVHYTAPFDRKAAYNNFAALEVEPDCGSYVPDISELVRFGDFHRQRKVTPKRTNWRDFHLLQKFVRQATFVETPRKSRDEFLLVKLRVAILQHVIKRSPGLQDRCRDLVDKLINKMTPLHATPESDVVESVQGKNDLVTDTAGNVTISHQEEVSSAITAPQEMNWSQLTTCDTVSSYSDITDRWYNLGSYEWTKNHAIGADICTTTRVVNNQTVTRRIVLPLDIVHSSGEDPCNMPNLMPFRVNAYWRGDMVVKLQVNSNKFQVGALQMSFIPQANAIEYVSLRQNVYTLSQLPHAIVMASASNEAELTIPYSHPYPYMPCRPIVDYSSDWSVLNMGTLYVKVLNPLNTVTNGPDSCSVSLYVKFINNTFTGLAHGSLFKYPQEKLHASPEMDVFTIQNAMRLLDTVASNDNRDLPPVNVDPMYVVPTASHSWCVGTGQPHHNHILRLDSRGQTHHPRESAVVEQMHVSNIVSKYGLVDQFSWHDPSTHRRGTLLASYDATPFVGHVLKGEGYQAITSYAPVGSVSALFMQWRGTLEFKFQFIASQFHTGRIIVGYVPGADSNTHMTLNALRASTHVVFDLQESREFVFEVPYISYKPWFARSMSGNYAEAAQQAPSRVYVYVLNPLINMPSLPDSVEVNAYLRAGPSFEVSVPVQQALGLSINSDFKFANDEVVHSKTAYPTYYPGTWHSVLQGKGLVMRSGALSDQVAEFTEPNYSKEPNTAFYFQIQSKEDAPTIGNKVPVEFMVLHSMGMYWIGLCADNEQAAQMLAKTLQIDKKDINSDEVLRYALQVPDTRTSDYCKNNPAWVRRAKIFTPIVTLSAVPEGEEAKAVNVISAPKSIMSTQHGRYLYGENFSDLRNLARRYQYYGRVYLGDKRTWDGNKCLFYFPALPQGLELDTGTTSQINELLNRCREGHIPYLTSAFRYYRGGLRFKVVMPSEINTMVWVQHRPDRKLERRIVKICDDIESAQGIWNHTYATYLQFTRVNNIIEFEVPFYNPTVYNFLQNLPQGIDAAFKWAISLGEIGIGCQLANEDLSILKNKEVMIYYALADDCAFTHWIGFPPMYKLDAIPYHAVPEAPPTQGFFDKFTAKATEKIKEKVVQESKETVKSEFKLIQDIVTNKLQACKIEVDPSHISMIISQVGHAILNPTWQTIAWCVVSILIMLGMMTVGLSKVAFAACGDCIKAIWNLFSFSKQAKQENTKVDEATTSAEPIHAVPEAPTVMPKSVGEKCAEWVGLLYNGLVTSMGLAVAKPKNMEQWTKFLVRDVGMNARSSNMVITFIKNTFDCMKAMVLYILRRSDKTQKTLQALESSPELVKAWAKEVTLLTDPKTKNERLGTYEYNNRVSEASNMAQIIMADLAGDIKTEKNSQALSKLYDKISTLQEELIQLGENPFVRKMPFAVYICGIPGIGKSFMTTHVMAHMLKAANIKPGPKGLKCTINPLSDFWDQCEHQPVLECDDMWAVTTDDAIATQLVTLLQVLSPIVLSPPKAALDEKKMRYNPDIMWMSSNKDFPKFNNVIPEVIWRRRDVLVNVSLAPITPHSSVRGCPHCETNTPLNQIDGKWLQDFHHLQFQFHEKPSDANAAYGPVIDFRQFVKTITRLFMEFRIREHQHFQQRIAVCEMLNSDYPIMLGDSIEKIYETLNEQRLHNYAKLEAHTLWNDIKQAGLFTVEQAKRMKRWLIGNSASEVPVAYCGPRNEASIKNNNIPATTDCDNAVAMPLTVAAIAELDAKSTPEERDRRHKAAEEDRLEWERRVAAMHAVPEGDDIDLAILQKDRTVFERICSALTGKFYFNLTPEQMAKYEIKQLNALVKADVLLTSEYNRYVYLCAKFDINPLSNTNFWNHYDVVLSRVITKCTHMLTLDKLFKYCHNERPIIIDNCTYDNHLLPYCAHMGYDMALVIVNSDRKLVYNNVEIEVNCKDHCVFDSPILKTLWYKLWLEHNPVPLSRYRRRQYNTLPAFLGAQNMIDAISIDSWFDQVVRELRSAWLKCVSIPVYNVYRWVCERMPTIITVMMSLFALSSLGVGSYYTWKTYKDNTQLVDEYASKLETIQDVKSMNKHGNTFIDLAVANETNAEKALIGSVMTAGLTGGLAKACNSRLLSKVSPTDKVFSPQSVNYNVDTPQRFLPRIAPKPVIHARAEDSSQYHGALERIEDNAFYLVCKVDGNVIVRFRGLILRAHMALFLRHYIEIFINIRKAQPTAMFEFQYVKRHSERVTSKMPIIVNIDAVKAMYFGDNAESSPLSNFVIMDLPKSVPFGADLIRFIATPQSISITNENCELVVPGIRVYSSIRVDFCNTAPVIIDPTHESGEVILAKYYKYNKHAKGLCGSILISPYSHKPILGMHVAGFEGPGGYGFSEPMFAEQFEQLQFSNVDVVKDIMTENLEHVDINSLDFRTALVIHGRVPPKFAQLQSNNSNIVPSLIHGVFDVRTAPNPLSARDKRLPPNSCPLIRGCEKHGIQTLSFPANELELARKSLSNKLKQVVLPISTEVGIRSEQDAICGHPKIIEFDAINFQTSAGYPFSRIDKNTHSGKKWLFTLNESTEGYVLQDMDLRLKTRIVEEMDMRKQGIKPFTVFSDCLKDTTLPIEKNSIPGKTRIFSISPIQFTIPFRQYFMDFMGAYRRNRYFAEHAIGINVNSGDWTYLAGQLTQYGDRIVTGDYKNFGPGLNCDVASAAFECILDWYEEHSNSKTLRLDNTVRAVMANEIVAPLHLCKDIVYSATAGIPSGSPITDILNSMVNCLYIRVAFVALTHIDLSEFDDYVILIVYGDDLIMNVKLDIIEKFNAVTLQEYFAKYDIVFTDVDKVGKTVVSRSLANSTFLKRQFRTHPTRPYCVLAPLDLISVEGSANWIKNTFYPSLATIANALQCCELAYGLGPEEYLRIHSQLIIALRKAGLQCVLPTWEMLDQRIWNNDVIQYVAVPNGAYNPDSHYIHICPVCFMSNLNHISHYGKLKHCINPSCSMFNRRHATSQILDIQYCNYDIE